MARIGGGRSKGCNTCRGRHVKCDERQPACSRCENGGYGCEGYIREHRFVDEVARTVRHVQKASAKQKSSPPSSSRDLIPCSSKSRTLPPEMSLVGFRDNVLVSFLLSNLFAGMGDVSIPWMRRQAEDTFSLTSQNSIMALSKVYFGRMHRQQDIIDQGFALYGDALNNLKRDLQDEENAWSLSVLTSAMTLQIYEFVAFSSKSGWLQHAGGIGRLVELRGPWRHQSPAERQIFEGSRVGIVLGCLAKRKRCFLEHQDWKTIPWTLEPESKTLAVLLHDLLIDLPGLMEDADALKSPTLSPNQLFVQHQVLLDNIGAHLAKLYAWRTNWEFVNPSACFEVFNPSIPENGELLFPTILHYSTLTAASEITTYNATLLLHLKLGYEVIGSTFNPSAQFLGAAPFSVASPMLSSNPVHLPCYAPNLQAIAIEICRSAEYHLSHGSAGAFCLLFPLRVAYQTFEDGTREKQWLEALMERVAERSGWEIGRNIGSDEAVGR